MQLGTSPGSDPGRFLRPMECDHQLLRSDRAEQNSVELRSAVAVLSCHVWERCAMFETMRSSNPRLFPFGFTVHIAPPSQALAIASRLTVNRLTVRAVRATVRCGIVVLRSGALAKSQLDSIGRNRHLKAERKQFLLKLLAQVRCVILLCSVGVHQGISKKPGQVSRSDAQWGSALREAADLTCLQSRGSSSPDQGPSVSCGDASAGCRDIGELDA